MQPSPVAAEARLLGRSTTARIAAEASAVEYQMGTPWSDRIDWRALQRRGEGPLVARSALRTKGTVALGRT